MNAKAILRSMRLRTLPLSLAGSVAGIFAAISISSVSVWTVVSLMLTTALLQILSNLSNELGDTLRGTDTEERAGIRYSLQDGDITVPQMKRLIACVAACCCLSGLLMIWLTFGTFLAVEPAALILLGAAAIWAAMHYTLGKHPYGYRGLGDIFVFIFFGLVSCCGACYVCAHDAGLSVLLRASLLPACSIGCFSVGVLNLNNIRDMATDAATRVTVAMKLGHRKARIYQTVLIASGWCFMAVNMILLSDGGFEWRRWLFLITLPLYVLHLKGVWTKEDRALDPMLPLLVLSTFAFACLSGLGMIL